MDASGGASYGDLSTASASKSGDRAATEKRGGKGFAMPGAPKADRSNPTGARGNGSNGPLERITVNLTGRASRALELAAQLTGDSKTDTVNRALQVYAYMEQITARGGSVYVREGADAELERLKVF